MGFSSEFDLCICGGICTEMFGVDLDLSRSASICVEREWYSDTEIWGFSIFGDCGDFAWN